jgi:hypothetical protein
MKTCAWISRHPPTESQRHSLSGYQIIQINPPDRLHSAADAVALSQTACGGWPDLYVVVMPIMMLQSFVERVNGQVPILRSVVKQECSPQWDGRWEQIISVEIVTKAWSQSRKETR